MGSSMLILAIVCIIGFGVLAYFMYMNMPGDPQELSFNIEKYKASNITYSEVSQFYPNMKFNHNAISYNVDLSCTEQKKEKMVKALIEISNKVNVIYFTEKSSSDADIQILCSQNEKLSDTRNDYFIAGEGGAKEIIQTGKYNVITQGIVLFYDNKDTLECDEPEVQMHEIMHVFGFNHSANPASLMYPLLESCNQKIDDSMIKELNRLYSEPNIPELYFDDVVAVRKGRYLDFNFTIRNAGDVDAKNVDYSIFDNGELVETKTIDEIKFGAGVMIWVQNLRLINRDSSQIKFVIDKDNKINEIDKTNNIAVVE